MKKGEVNLNKYKDLVRVVIQQVVYSDLLEKGFGSMTQDEILALNSELQTEEYRVKRGIKSAKQMTEDDYAYMYEETALSESDYYDDPFDYDFM